MRCCLLLYLIVAFSACQFFSRTGTPPVLTHQHFTYAGSGQCDTTTNRGVSVRADYSLLNEGEQHADIINDTLQARIVCNLTGWLDSLSLAQHPQAQKDLKIAATVLAADYHQMQQDVGMMGGCWEIDIKSDTVFTDPKTLTVALDTYAYTGGAHPNTYRTLLSFDRHSGQPLRVTDLVTDTTALLPIVEQAFRRQQAIQPTHSLEEEGYFLQDGQFFLPQNVAAGRKGLIFYYNPYEIAAYALGPIELVVPYDQLAVLLKRTK